MYDVVACVHWHTEGRDLGTATNISYDPSINSVAQLIKVTVELLDTQNVTGRSTIEVEQITELSDLVNCGNYVDDN